jgi:predicted nucleotidyltransferase
MIVGHAIRLNAEETAAFCQRHGIVRLSLYGSVLREDFGPDSDIDVLVEFAPGQTPSLLDLGGMQVELSEMLGREVDLKTPGFLSPEVLKRVLVERRVEYAA